MAQKVAKTGVKRAEGFLYFIDKQGDVSRAKMARGGKKGGASDASAVRRADAARTRGVPARLVGRKARGLPGPFAGTPRGCVGARRAWVDRLAPRRVVGDAGDRDSGRTGA